MRQATFVLTGETPLMMSNVRTANPLDPFARKLKALHHEKKTKKPKDDDEIALLEKIIDTEWRGRIYHDEEMGPYIPGSWVRGVVREGAKKDSNGAKVKRALFVMDTGFPLEYEGPRGLEELRADPRFITGPRRYRRLVGAGHRDRCRRGGLRHRCHG